MDFHGSQLRVADRARLYAPVAVMRAIHAGAWILGEPLLQPSPSETLRHPALRLVGQAVATHQRPFSVLLVDDDPLHRARLLRALRDQKHTVLHAADGASGESLFRRSQLEIDALVACADMDRMCGFELARRLRRVRPEVQVLLMCPHFAGPDETHRAYERGYPVIEEPFTPEELCRRLTCLLASPRYDTCAEPRLDGKRRGILHEAEVVAIDSKKEN